jgi:hypothetical protein
VTAFAEHLEDLTRTLALTDPMTGDHDDVADLGFMCSPAHGSSFATSVSGRLADPLTPAAAAAAASVALVTLLPAPPAASRCSLVC